MKKVLVNGCNGKMGRNVCEVVEKSENLKLIGGVDIEDIGLYSVPVYENYNDIKEKPDVIIDFSIPIATFGALDYAKKNGVPIVIATTGFDKKQESIIQEYSKTIPIFKSANMSFSVIMMKNLLKQIAPKFKDADIEIIDIHHNRKIDSPSGTAQMFADEINDALGNDHYCEYNRHDKHEKRNKKEIGITGIRGGNIVGEHIVQFYGESETFEIKHTTYSRNVFAEGAVRAAEFLVKQKPGFYNMDDLCV